MIKSDNIFLFKKNGLIDSQRSNRFKYNEDNIETYVQYTLSLNKLELSTGLRMEYMYTNNRLHSYANQLIEENNRRKLNLFPNMSISYAFNRRKYNKLFAEITKLIKGYDSSVNMTYT